MYKLLLPAATLLLYACAQNAGPLPDIRIMDTEVFPESITALNDGTVFAGSVKGIVYRAEPGSAEAHPWVRHSPENGILTILGVLGDTASNTLWLCSAPNFFGPERAEGVSSVIALDLDSGERTGHYPFPDGGVCNDLSLAPDGTLLATDTPGGRILALDPGSSTLRVFGQAEQLRGIDGLAFSEDGTLYVNNVQSNEIFRVDINADNTMGALTSLQLSTELGGPDGMRLIDGNRFIQAEGTIGRLGIVTINGDTATLEVLRDDLKSSPGATVVGNTAYVIESNIQYLRDPNLRDQEPPPFLLYAIPF